MFFFLFVFFFFCVCSEKPHDLVLDGNYTSWRTQGNLTPSFFRVLLDERKPPSAIRVNVDPVKFVLEDPITLTIIRGTTVHNIALPRIQSHQGSKFIYWCAADTLCDDTDSLKLLRQPVFISIASSLPSDFVLRVQQASNFHIGQDPTIATASPPKPTFHVYSFPDNVEKVEIRAFSASDICARITVRSFDCPLFDPSGLLELSDNYFYQTFTKFAGFTLKKSDIGEKFHLALTVLPDDSLCGKSSENLTDNPYRIKSAQFTVIPVSEQTLLSMTPLLVYAGSMTFVLLLTFFQYRMLDRYENNEPSIFEGNDSEGTVIVDRVHLFDKFNMTVSHKEYQKQRLVKDSKYFVFLFFQIFGSILPALTVLFPNKKNAVSKMNLDTCYFNYRCSLNSFGFLSFNSLTSASSSAVIGFINLIIVFRKKIFCYQVPRLPTTHGIQQRDAPKVVCLLGLVSKGVLQFITRNCPDESTVHLFNYNCLWLYYSALLWIYSKRHGVRKWQQFYIIAVSSIFGCITFLDMMIEDSSKIILNMVYLLCSVLCTGYFCFKYYYEIPSGLQEHQWIKPRNCNTEKTLPDENGVYHPLDSKIIYVIAAMLYSIYSPFSLFINSNYSVNRAIFIMGKSQIGIYFFWYIIQKIRFEWSTFTRFYKIMGFGIVSVFVFFETFVNIELATTYQTFSVSLTPAKSRELNVECALPGIDWNDLLHYNCAFNCFTFIIIMDFIDSNIKGVPKKNIFVF